MASHDEPMAWRDDPICSCSHPPPSVNRAAFLAAIGATAAAVQEFAAAAPALAASPTPSPAVTNELVILGTAAGPPPVPGRTGIASALVIDGRTYVIDCGRSSVTQYANAKLGFDTLAGIFITHLHADHVCDLYNFFLLGSGWSPPTNSLRSPIPVYGPKSPGLPLPPPTPAGRAVSTVAPGQPAPGLGALMRHCDDAFAYSTNVLMRDSGIQEVGRLASVQEIVLPPVGAKPLGPTAPKMNPFQVARLGDVLVTATLVPHGICFPSYAYRFDSPQGSIVFSGDTALTPNLVTLARGADVLVHEAISLQWFQSQKFTPTVLSHMMSSHTDIADVAGVAKAADVKTVIVSHIAPGDPSLVSNAEWQDLANAGARKVNYSGRIIIGSDLSRFDLSGRQLA